MAIGKSTKSSPGGASRAHGAGPATSTTGQPPPPPLIEKKATEADLLALIAAASGRVQTLETLLSSFSALFSENTKEMEATMADLEREREEVARLQERLAAVRGRLAQAGDKRCQLCEEGRKVAAVLSVHQGRDDGEVSSEVWACRDCAKRETDHYVSHGTWLHLGEPDKRASWGTLGAPPAPPPNVPPATTADGSGNGGAVDGTVADAASSTAAAPTKSPPTPAQVLATKVKLHTTVMRDWRRLVDIRTKKHLYLSERPDERAELDQDIAFKERLRDALAAQIDELAAEVGTTVTLDDGTGPPPEQQDAVRPHAPIPAPADVAPPARESERQDLFSADPLVPGVPRPTSDPDSIAATLAQAAEESAAGNVGLARQHLKAVLDVDESCRDAWLALACLEAKQGAARIADAFFAVERCLQHGYRDFTHLEAEPALASLREVDAFFTVLEKYRKSTRKQRRRRTQRRDSLTSDLPAVQTDDGVAARESSSSRTSSSRPAKKGIFRTLRDAATLKKSRSSAASTGSRDSTDSTDDSRSSTASADDRVSSVIVLSLRERMEAAVTLMRDGDYEAAQVVLESTVLEAPQSAALWFNLAGCSTQLGRTDRALEHLAKALELGMLRTYGEATVLADTDVAPLQRLRRFRKLLETHRRKEKARMARQAEEDKEAARQQAQEQSAARASGSQEDAVATAGGGTVIVKSGGRVSRKEAPSLCEQCALSKPKSRVQRFRYDDVVVLYLCAPCVAETTATYRTRGTISAPSGSSGGPPRPILPLTAAAAGTATLPPPPPPPAARRPVSRRFDARTLCDNCFDNQAVGLATLSTGERMRLCASCVTIYSADAEADDAPDGSDDYVEPPPSDYFDRPPPRSSLSLSVTPPSSALLPPPPPPPRAPARVCHYCNTAATKRATLANGSRVLVCDSCCASRMAGSDSRAPRATKPAVAVPAAPGAAPLSPRRPVPMPPPAEMDEDELASDDSSSPPPPPPPGAAEGAEGDGTSDSDSDSVTPPPPPPPEAESIVALVDATGPARRGRGVTLVWQAI
uniref:Uncharacterized protein n=2 Tax=Sexangularia sp. CB-2014 TaxID=1486929 RepID=A0A7S1VCX7_9EUKA